MTVVPLLGVAVKSAAAVELGKELKDVYQQTMY